MPPRSALLLAVALLITLVPPCLASSDSLPSYISPSSVYDTNNKTIEFEYPQYDENDPIRYIPNFAIAILATVLYFLVSAALAFELKVWGQKWMLTLIIGGFCYCFGMAVRLWFRKNTHSSGVYIILYLFTVLSPCAFLATDYVLLGRLVRHLGMDQHLRVKAHKTTRIFVGSDIATFLIQAAGGGLATSRNPSTNDTGSKIFLAGIVLQMVSFLIFTFLTIDFGLQIRKHQPHLWTGSNSREDARWKQLFYAMLWTCVGFLIRSFFRTVELSQGFRGRLSTHEIYIYCLDTLPLFIAIIIYVPFYPGRYLRPRTAGAHEHAYTAEGVLKLQCGPYDLSMEEKPAGRTWYGRRRNR